MTEVRQGTTPRVHFRGVRYSEVPVKRELTVPFRSCLHLTLSEVNN